MGRGGSPTLSIALICVPSIFTTHCKKKNMNLRHPKNSFVEQFSFRSLITRYLSKALDVCSRVGAAQDIHSCTERKALGQLVLLDSTCYHACICSLSTSWSTTTLMRKSNLVVGFALRCFQRLSRPDADTRRCSWRNNRYTGGRSITVLSY